MSSPHAAASSDTSAIGSPSDDAPSAAGGSPLSPASTSMTVLLAAKKLKLEALKAQRIRRQSLAQEQASRAAAKHTQQQGVVLIADAADVDDEEEDDDAEDVDASASLPAATVEDESDNESRATGVITLNEPHAAATALDDSSVSALNDSSATDPPASSSLSSPVASALSPPSLSRSKSRQSDQSLLSIKHSLDELATHGSQQPAVPEAVVVKACAAFRRMSLIGHKTLPMPSRSLRNKSGQFSPSALATPKSPEANRAHSSSNASSAQGMEASSPSANGHAAAAAGSIMPDYLSRRTSTGPLPELEPENDKAEPEHATTAETEGDAVATVASAESVAPASPSSANGSSSASHAAQIDELLAQIGELSEAVRSKNEDLAMAGDLGSVLLQHNEDAQRKIDELTSALDSSAQRVAALENEVRHGERALRKLTTKHTAELRWMEQEAQSEAEILRMELEIERQNFRHAEEQWKARAKENAAREEEDAERGTEIDALRAHVHKLESQVADLKRHNLELDESLASLREERSELTTEVERLSRIETKYVDLQGELAVLKKQDTINVLAELQWENQRMVTAMQELNAEYEAVLDAQAHDATVLETLQRRNELLEKEAHAAKIGSQTLRTPAPRSFESLADDEVVEEAPTPTNAMDIQRHASATQQPAPIAAPTAIPSAITAAPVAAPEAAAAEPAAVSVVITPAPAPATATASASALPPPHPVPSAAAAPATIPPPVFTPTKSASSSSPASPTSPNPTSPIAAADSVALPPIAPDAAGGRKSSSKSKPPPSATDEAFAAEQEILSVARLAAECAQKGPHSSLASGSASLAYSSAAAFSPAKRHSMFHISSANSPSLLAAQSASSGMGNGSGGSHHVRTKTPQRGGFSGFLSALLPGSTGAAATTASPRQSLSGSGAAAAMAMSGGGGSASGGGAEFMRGNSAHKLSFTPTSSHPLSPGAVGVDESLTPTPERSSSHRSTPLKATASSRLPSEGRDADFEFFALTLLCVKINGARKMESLYTISTQDLWNKAKQEDIQFHQYTAWLEKEIAKTYARKLSTAKKDGSDGEPILDSFLPSNSSVSSTAAAKKPSNPVANAAVLAATAAAVNNAPVVGVAATGPVTAGQGAPHLQQLHSVARSPTPI